MTSGKDCCLLERHLNCSVRALGNENEVRVGNENEVRVFKPN